MILEDKILFVDGEIIVLDKPAGLPVDTPRRGGDSVVSRIEQGELHLGFKRPPVPMHRLDQDTSGCLALARTPGARKKLQAAFEGGQVEKVYLAVIDGEVDGDDGLIDLPLAKVSSRDRGWRMVPDPDGQKAETGWTRLAVRDGRTLVRFRPRTGRTHQLRAHALAAFGKGIVGDPVYGSGAGAMMLHAIRLSIWGIGRNVDVEAPLPRGFAGWAAGDDAIAEDEARMTAELKGGFDADLDKVVYANEDGAFFEQARFAARPVAQAGESWLIEAYARAGWWDALVERFAKATDANAASLMEVADRLQAANAREHAVRLWQAIADTASRKADKDPHAFTRKSAHSTLGEAQRRLAAIGADEEADAMAARAATYRDDDVA